jgi:hypothetical protein
LCDPGYRAIFAPANSAARGEGRLADSGELHSYRLVFTSAGGAIEVEFDETCADPAFNIARKACGAGEVHIFVDDRLLGCIGRPSLGRRIASRFDRLRRKVRFPGL